MSLFFAITAPNLTFQEFLTKMNKASQIHRAEYQLKQIDGHTIVASKHKRKTFARHSSDTTSSTLTEYSKPKNYSEFVKELTNTCVLGDKDSKEAIMRLAPEMAKTLQLTKPNQWDNPNIAIEVPPTGISIISTDFNAGTSRVLSSDLHDKLIDGTLGPISPPTLQQHTNDENVSTEINEAFANFIMDMEHITEQSEPTSLPKKISSLLKSAQPYRERPSSV